MRNADLSNYGDSMRPLIEQDMAETEGKLRAFAAAGQPAEP